MNQGLTWTGAGLLLAAILIPIVTFSVGADSGGWEAIVFGVIFAFVISPILGTAGLIMLIVGLATGGGQKQQQQVVVHVGGPGAPGQGAMFRCARCGNGLGAQDAFCTGCGMRAVRG